jgi:hypothetical protein
MRCALCSPQNSASPGDVCWHPDGMVALCHARLLCSLSAMGCASWFGTQRCSQQASLRPTHVKPAGWHTCTNPAMPATVTLPSWHRLCLRSAELLRENKRMLDKAIRELDRERLGLQNQDKKLITEIKKMAKANQMVRRRQPAAAPTSS